MQFGCSSNQALTDWLPIYSVTIIYIFYYYYIRVNEGNPKYYIHIVYAYKDITIGGGRGGQTDLMNESGIKLLVELIRHNCYKF